MKKGAEPLFDIDFLKAAAPAIPAHILYTYVHGVFAREVKEKVEELY